MAEIDFSDICYETRGIFVRGRLKFNEAQIQYKNSRTGKVEQILANDVDHYNWYRFCLNWGIRIYTKQGALYRFGGFKDADREKITKFVKTNYDFPMPEKDISVKGWNWGTAKFSGSVLTFEVDNKMDFEIPLGHVSQCIAGKNEVTLEFHPNEEAPTCLMELRFHIPGSELAGDDPVDAFRDHVLQKADVISDTDAVAVAIFREASCLTPRGRYDITIYPSFFQLHGKTFDYKIAMSTVLRLFLLPHKDGRQIFFVISLDPPIKQGQTRYHYLTFIFPQEDEDRVSIELPFSDEEIQTKYDGKLTKDMSGYSYEVISKLMKVLVNRKITTPGNFVGHSGTPAIACHYKAAAGYMYPLDRGLIYIHKPPLHIRFEEVSCVNFARSGGSTRSFDFEVELRSGLIYTFSSIEKEEYPKLFDFVTGKKIRIKNSGKNKQTASFADFDDSDKEAEPDAYLARVKAEAEARSDDDDDDDEGSDEDADFDPNLVRGGSDVAEEFDSNASESTSDEEEDGESSSKPKKKKESKKHITSDKDERKKSSKKSSDDKKSSKKSSDDKRSSSSSKKSKESSKKSPVKSNVEYKSKEFIESDTDSD